MSAGFDCLVDIEKERILDVRDDHPYAAALPLGKTAGVQVRMIFQFLHCLHHPCPRRALDQGRVIQHAGNGSS